MTSPTDPSAECDEVAQADQAELRAVAERYARRTADDRYNPLRPDVWQAQQERQRALIMLLRRHVDRPMATLDALEVGCGHGDNLLELLRLGCDPAHLIGNELLPERAAAARHRLPAALRIHEGDACALPLADASLDLVLQYTVFSSLLDPAFQARLAAAMWRWLRPGGAVLWYDFTWDNPRNPDVVGMPLSRIRQLFPEGRIEARRITLAPPLARQVVRLQPAAYSLLNSLPWLRTHLLCWIKKPP